MNFLNLKYFLALSQDLNFSRSATRLYISQQSLSAHISRLEKECGLQLFYRDPPLRLTPAGEEFAAHAYAILREKESLEKKLNDLRDMQQGNITIGIPGSRGIVMLPKVLSRFREEFPHIKIHTLEGTSDDIFNHLLKGRADLNLGFQSEESDLIKSEKLYVEYTRIVVPNTILERMPNREEILDANGPIPLSTFAEAPFITLEESTLTGHLFYTISAEEKFTPKVVVDTKNLLTMLSLCYAGIGICICPNCFLSAADPLVGARGLEGITIFPLASKRAEQWIVADRLKSKYCSQPEKRLLAIIKEVYGST